jgi:hypothetical protein
MCVCTPGVRTPYCGKPGCVWPGEGDLFAKPVVVPQVSTSVEDRLKALEEKFGEFGCFPGTLLVRVGHATETEPYWSLGLGSYNQSREFFVGKTIEDVLTQAEKFEFISVVHLDESWKMGD